MKIFFERKFLKEISSLNDPKIRALLEETILDAEKAKTTSRIKNLKKLKGFKNAYRIRIGDYRVGILIDKDTLVFVRFLHRKEVYKYFP